MTFLIAAAGTGGHVFPGLAVGEALVSLGVHRDEVAYVGGDRLEAKVYPDQGFRFIQVELAGLKRSLTIENARIPGVVMRARAVIRDEIADAGARVVLGMGGYVTIPAGLAARSRRVPFFNAEQNAEAGLANRVTSRWARQTFVAFPDTGGLTGGVWVGNPVRRPFWDFDRETLRPIALEHFGISDGVTVVGVFGGSLGAKAVNDAVAAMLARWEGPGVAVVHLTGESHVEAMKDLASADGVEWVRRGFEERMELFYAVSDVVIARAGGAVAELTATATPSVLVPGQFGSAGHQTENARALETAGAALVVAEEALGKLSATVRRVVDDPGGREGMRRAAAGIAKPRAALTIAGTMIEAVT
jgi:UDP-N-acetylglucosamine--N-acetylmuramyl-(pentapeptide) pyrophosphoryl-undecaprenol N-acetylglucosamine transferase